MNITKSPCRFPIFFYLGDQWNQVNIKFEQKKVVLFDYLKNRQRDRQIYVYIYKHGIYIYALN